MRFLTSDFFHESVAVATGGNCNDISWQFAKSIGDTGGKFAKVAVQKFLFYKNLN
jgi:hypothetical protein